MENILEYIKNNKEWIFSGIGVMIITVFFGLFKRNRKLPPYVINNNINLNEIIQKKKRLIPELNPYEKENNILVRKSFNTADMVDFFEIIGYETIIRQLDKFKDNNFFAREINFHSELKSPKLIVFQFEDNGSTNTGILLIKTIEFNESEQIQEILQIGKLNCNKIGKLQVTHNHIEYNAKISKDNGIILDFQRHGILSGKTLKPLFLLLTSPEKTEIQSIDIIVELYAIDFLFYILINATWDKKIKKSAEMSWGIKFIQINKITKRVLNRIRDFLPTEFCWILTGKINEDIFVDFFFYNDANKKLKEYIDQIS